MMPLSIMDDGEGHVLRWDDWAEDAAAAPQNSVDAALAQVLGPQNCKFAGGNMQVGIFGLSVLVAGRPVREYMTGGKTLVAGKHGSDYVLRLTNRSRNRIKAVLTVDGRSVIDGKAGSLEGSGYILD